MTGAKTALFSRKQRGGVFAIEDQSRSTGDRVYVHSGTGSDAAGYGYTPDKPVATIDYAVGLCTASQNDIIYVMPGHAESISGATSLVVDVIGVSIIGLGSGALRPKLTFTAADGTVSVTAANVRIENIQFYSNFAEIVTALTVGADADGFRLINTRWEEAAANKEFLIGVSIAAACHDVGIDGFDWYGVITGSETSAIVFAGASNYSYVRNFRIFGDFSGAAIDALTAASLFMDFGPGVLINVDTTAGLLISVKSDTTGFMHDINAMSGKNDVTVVGAAMNYCTIKVTNAAGAQGRIDLPAVDT
ncbi:MAG: hypothetical protein WC683_13650 [bacterium]